MRLFPPEDEERFYWHERAEAWLRSKLVTPEQHKAAKELLGEPPARAGIAIRILFFGLTVSAVLAFHLFFLHGMRQREAMATILVLAGCATYALGERVLKGFKLYRFGLEEALLLSGAVQIAVGAAFLFEKRPMLFVGGLAGAAGGAWLYARVGYLYAAYGALAGLVVMLVSFDLQEDAFRLGLVLVFAVLLRATASRKSVPRADAEGWQAIQASLAGAICLALNLQLERALDPSRLTFTVGSGPLYWPSLLLLCLIPPVILYWGVVSRKRAVIMTGAGTILVTIVSLKPYLGIDRHSYDPALLGAALMLGAGFLARWLNAGPNGRRGAFTAQKLIVEKDGFPLDALVAVSPLQHSVSSAGPEPYKGGGGSSGGAGASGTY